MSVLVLSTETFQAIHAGLIFSAYHTTIDEYYSPTAREYFKSRDIEREAERMVKSWVTLNCKSYAARYNEKLDDDGKRMKLRSNDKPMTLQLIKSLQCLVYNIELTTIQDPQRAQNGGEVTDQERKDYKFLADFITDLQCSFIGSLPEYQNAKWA